MLTRFVIKKTVDSHLLNLPKLALEKNLSYEKESKTLDDLIGKSNKQIPTFVDISQPE